MAAVAVLALSGYASASEHVFTSPGEALKFHVTTGESLRFALDLNGQQVIRPSALGFVFKNEPEMQANLDLIEPPTVAEGLVDEWTPVVRNKHAHIRLVYNEAVLKLQESKGERRRMDLTVRLYADGAAFRYTLYGRNRPEERLITDELTEYRVPETSFAWVAWQKGDYTHAHETDFNRWPVTSIPSKKWCFSPLLVEVDKSHFLALTSAFLDDYPGFFTTWRDGALKTRLAPTVAEGPSGVKARFDRRFDTPWRVILAGDNPGKFIESEIIRSLNPPCAIADTSWIKPGLSSWDHWWSGDVKMEMPVIKEYIDFAAQQGWPYMLVDWQWYGPFNRPTADITKWAEQIDLPELIRYAKERNVRLWLWLYCADANRNDAYVEAFRLYRQWGIAGVKIDFMDRYDREVVNWYRRMTAAAAENHLMIDFHGAFPPDGIDRTYPNQVTREGAMSEEYYKFSRRMTPKHNVTLCFTRMLAGAMDYTPGGFLNVTPEKFRPQKPTLVMNTRAAELAKFVLYESPVAFVSDHPRHILGQPGADFLKIVPTEWDDTRFLGGAPAEWIALAKKSGERWFVAVLGGDDAREVELDLSALGAGTNLRYWADGDEPSKPVCGTATCADGRLKVKLAPGGGYVAIATSR